MHRKRRMVSAACAAAVAGLALALAGGASANHVGIATVTGKAAQLVGGVYLAVPIQITCPGDLSSTPYTFVYEEDVEVKVAQKTSGRTIARGTGGFFYVDNSLYGWGGPEGTPLICDDAPHTYSVNVFPGSIPFHGGQAVVEVRVVMDLRNPYDPWSQNDYNVADSGPRTISIKG